MKVGDLVRYQYDVIRQPPLEGMPIGIITHIDPEGIGDRQEVLVMWNDGGGLMNHSMGFLEVVNNA